MSLPVPLADGLGWVATAVFAASYLCARPATLRRVQMAGALIWTAYGVLQHAAPVVVANLLVLGAAGYAARREARSATVLAD